MRIVDHSINKKIYLTAIAIWFTMPMVVAAQTLVDNYQRSASIEGYMVDSETGQRLAAANVELSYGFTGAFTDDNGYFKIDNISPGSYTIISSCIGYKNARKNIQLKPGQTVRININLQPKEYQIDEIVIKPDAKNGSRTIGQAEVDPSLLNTIPSVIQTDLFRSLQLLPGIQASSDYSSGLHIRGGSPDQTLVLFDHAPVYNPSHFFGFYSTFNSSAIENANLYKGNYPAEYGSRLGSVLSISGKDGSKKDFGGEVSLGMLAAGASVEVPLFKDKGAWMLAIRRSTIDPVLGVLQNSYEDIPKRFYLLDINGKAIFDPDQYNRLSFSVYSGMDKLIFPFAKDARITLDYGNQLFSGTWKHIFSDKITSEFNISGSRYFNFPVYDVASTPYKRSNNIYDFSLNSTTEYLPNDDHDLTFGMQLTKQRLKLTDNYDGNQTFNSDINQYSSAAFLQDAWTISDKFTFTPGLRLNQYGNGNYLIVEPRLSLEYRPVSRLRFQAAYGKYSQGLSLSSTESFSGLDVWLTSNEDVPPSRGDQYAFGVKTNPFNGYRFDVELYYRTMNQLFEPDPVLLSKANTPYEDLFRFGKGYAYGTEVLLQRNVGKLTGFIGYTYSISRRKFENVGSYYYPTRYDRTHDLNVVINYKLNSRWSTSAVFSYASGQPFTRPMGRTTSFESPLSGRIMHQTIPGKKNAAHMPAYNRLDLGINRKGTFFGMGEAKWQIQVINVYSRRNTWFYNYDLNQGAYPKRNEVQLLPILPSVSYSLNF